jgi:23S rRNA (cytidine1920-2'-O)/16S rRNA (cytidine1409-2'-O)-methyltransferase
VARQVETLRRAIERRYPEIEDPAGTVRAGHVSVDGRIVMNPASVVSRGSNVVVAAPARLRGEAKLRAGLHAFSVSVESRIALDVGASAGGFTRVLLAAGASKVYAVDAGHGQLLGSLRQDRRVVNLEATNLAELNLELVPDQVAMITVDVSYLSLASAVPQLESLAIAGDADLVALVKPMFELALDRPPEDRERLEQAASRAEAAIGAGPWEVRGVVESPVTGSRGAVEFLLHARRRNSVTPRTASRCS